MANSTNRVIILAVCSVSVLALTIAYYWQLKKRRKLPSNNQNITSTLADNQSSRTQEEDNTTQKNLEDKTLEETRLGHKESGEWVCLSYSESSSQDLLETSVTFTDSSISDSPKDDLKINKATEPEEEMATEDKPTKIVNGGVAVVDKQEEVSVQTKQMDEVDGTLLSRSSNLATQESKQTEGPNIESALAADTPPSSEDGDHQSDVASPPSPAVDVVATTTTSSSGPAPPTSSPTFAQVLLSSSSSHKLVIDPNVALPSLLAEQEKVEIALSSQMIKATYSQIVNNNSKDDSKAIEANSIDSQSQDSADSGQGGDSDNAAHIETSSPAAIDAQGAENMNKLALDQNETICYQFRVPEDLCGQLIGTQGHAIKNFKIQSKTKIVVIDHSATQAGEVNYKICEITGLRKNVNKALELIRYRFPIGQYPEMTMEALSVHVQRSPSPSPVFSLAPQLCQLQLPRDIMFEAIITVIVDAGHFFVQQPTHPTYPCLAQLDSSMAVHYNGNITPGLPHVNVGLVCAASFEGGWYRALINATHEDFQTVDILYVDHGGFDYNVPISHLRQLLIHFLNLPFQATECFLYNVVPFHADEGWSDEAISFLEKSACGLVGVTVKGFSPEANAPLVELFRLGNPAVSIGQELVNNGLAKWATPVDHPEVGEHHP